MNILKNHKIIDGRLLQTNKKFSSLKGSQKTKISEWENEAYKECYLKYNSGEIVYVDYEGTAASPSNYYDIMDRLY